MSMPDADDRGSRVEARTRTLMRAGTFWSIIFQLSSKISVLVGLLVATRVLSVSEFGLLAACQGAVVVASAVLDFGSSILLERELAAGRADARLAWSIARRRIVVVVPTAVILGATADLALDDVSAGLGAACVIAVVAMNGSALTNGVLQGLLSFKASALTQTAGRLTYLVGMSLVWLLGPGSTALLQCAAIFALSEFALLAAQLAVIGHRRIPEVVIAPESARRRYRLAGAYWLNSIFSLIYNRADATIVAALAGASAAGVYAPASSIQSALIVVPGVITAGLPNVGASLYRSGGNDADVRRLARRAAGLAVGVGVFTSVIAVLAIVPAAVFALGAEYRNVTIPASILVASIPFYGAEFALLGYLVAIGRPELTVAGFSVALVTSIVLNVILVPRFGATGAAFANLAREPAAVLALILAARRSRAFGWSMLK